MPQPLHGMRVIDFTHVVAGPLTTHLLRLLGAEVIKIESAAGDPLRNYSLVPEERGMAPAFVGINAGKKSVVLDLKSDAGVAAARDLVAGADIVVENFRPGVLSRLGLGFETCKSLNPEIRVIGAEPALTPKYYQSRRKGARVSLPLLDTIADGLRISVPGQNPWPIIERHVDEIVTVEDAHIVAGMQALARDAKLVAEPSAAIGVGALLAGTITLRPGEKVCTILTGGNWGLTDLAAVYARKTTAIDAA